MTGLATVASVPPRNKAEDRGRIENLYLMRKITRDEFHAWLKLGDHK